MSEIPQPPTPKKEAITPLRESAAVEPADDTPDTERNYGETRLWLAARDPRSLFAYWEFRPEEHPDAFGEDGRARFFLRIFRDDGHAARATPSSPSHHPAPVTSPSWDFIPATSGASSRAPKRHTRRRKLPPRPRPPSSPRFRRSSAWKNSAPRSHTPRSPARASR
jgi:hypothetical protein